MAIQIQYRRGLASEWTATNPILAIGEPGYEIGEGDADSKFKIGDGETAWNDLNYMSGTEGLGFIGVSSSTSVTLGTPNYTGGLYNFLTGTAVEGGSGAFKVGDYVRIVDNSNSNNFVEGTITFFQKSTPSENGIIRINPYAYSGSGTISVWNISLSAKSAKSYYGITSNTNTITIGSPTNGLYTFSIPSVIGTGAYKVGDQVRVSETSSSVNYIDGIITSVTQVSGSTSGTIIVSSQKTNGSGTPSSWTFALAGSPSFGYSGVTSTTSVTIGTPNNGSNYTFVVPSTVGTGAYKLGDFVRVSDISSSSNYIDGTISTFTAINDSTSASITVSPQKTGGSGSISSWKFGIAGTPSFGYSGVTSTTSVTIGTPNNGSNYTFVIPSTVGTGAYQNYQRVRVSSSSTPTKYIEGTISAFTGISGATSGSITVTPETTGGTGTISDPVFSISGGSGFGGITSSASVTIPTSSFTSGSTYTFVVNTPGALSVGTRVRAYSSASVSRYIEGPISSINSSTSSIVISADTFGGVGGTISSWIITVAGGNGYTGITGTNSATLPNLLFTFGTGSKTFAVNGIGAYQVGQRVRIFQTSSGSNYMEGSITGISGSSTTNPQITVNVETTAGNASWTSAEFSFALAANITTTAVEFVIDGGGDVILSGTKGYIEIPFSGSVTQWTLMADQSGSMSVDIGKTTFNSFSSQNASAIAIVTGSARPIITSSTKGTGTTSSWSSTAITAGDILAFGVENCSSITRATLSLKFTRAT